MPKYHHWTSDDFVKTVNKSAAASELLHSRVRLCDRIDGSPPGSPGPGILQARTLEGGCPFLLSVTLQKHVAFLKTVPHLLRALCTLQLILPFELYVPIIFPNVYCLYVEKVWGFYLYFLDIQLP